MKTYINYRNSEVRWIGKIPSEWQLKKLKFVTDIRNSNVDKKVSKNEKAVLLCNYVDTYKNEKISKHLNFMEATANEQEIQNFSLKKGDVIITKDSETPDDIAIPAYVENDLEGIVCGYHQTLIRPNLIRGGFLFRYFQNLGTRQYYETMARGVTRYGLSLSTIKDMPTLVPPVEEQNKIFAFLDYKTTLIDSLISKNQKQIKLLAEKKQAMINQAVTKGLNSKTKMKDSGIEWTKQIPFKWEVYPLFAKFIENKDKNKNLAINKVLSLSYGAIVKREIETNFGLLPASFESYQILKPGYLVLRLTDLQNDKKSLRVGYAMDEGIITSAYVGLKPTISMNSKYFYYLLHTYDIQKVFYGFGSGVRQTMSFFELKHMPLIVPPVEEQNKIVDYIDQQTLLINKKIMVLKKQTELLREYRQALISNVVTGKIDVRDEEIPQEYLTN